MSEKEQELPDPAKLLKKVLAEAHFDNTDIGGVVFSMLDSLSYDFIANGWEHSDATEDLMQEVINILAKDYDDLRSDDTEEEEDETDAITIVSDAIAVGTEEEDDIPVIAILEEGEDIEEDVPNLEDISDLVEEVPNGTGNQEVANK